MVGFDLDMTLVDSAAGIAVTLQAALAEVGASVPDDAIWPWIGVPLDVALRTIAPHVDIAAVVTRYRALYTGLGVPSVTALPGAAEALTAAEALGGRVVVVSAKVPAAVHAVLDRVGLAMAAGPVGADIEEARRRREVVGGLFAAEKATALRHFDAGIYVGDHPGDVEAARSAGSVAVAVATGPHDASALAEAGADVVLDDLTAFPAWLRGYVDARGIPPVPRP